MFSNIAGIFRKLFTMVVAAVVAGVAFVVVPVDSASADSTVDVYSTAGRHSVNGREWRTWCEDYSSTIQRCFTEIMSGDEWVHNNLTYLPSSRAAWGANPLANNGTWKSSGKSWRTECDTARTGRNGCRSYVLSGNEWVFNNIVMFGEAIEANTTWRPSSKTWTVRLRNANNNNQAELDDCTRNPALWKNRQQITAHNYCNNREADKWHGMKQGDKVVVYDVNGNKFLEGIVERDFTAKYGSRAMEHPHEVAPAIGSDRFWLQTSWIDAIAHDSNHFIVIKRI